MIEISTTKKTAVKRRIELVVILLPLCLVVTKAQSSGICYLYNKVTKNCQICYQAKVNSKTGRCGTITAHNHCNFWGFTKIQDQREDICITCMPGYASSSTPKDGLIGSTCIRDAAYIKNCFSEVNFLGEISCSACYGGVPTDDLKACQSWSEIPHPIANCKIGARTRSHIYCGFCENGLTINEATGKCELVKGFVGCVAVKNGQCIGCDVLNGYAQQASGECVKKR